MKAAMGSRQKKGHIRHKDYNFVNEVINNTQNRELIQRLDEDYGKRGKKYKNLSREEYHGRRFAEYMKKRTFRGKKGHFSQKVTKPYDYVYDLLNDFKSFANSKGWKKIDEVYTPEAAPIPNRAIGQLQEAGSRVIETIRKKGSNAKAKHEEKRVLNVIKRIEKGLPFNKHQKRIISELESIQPGNESNIHKNFNNDKNIILQEKATKLFSSKDDSLNNVNFEQLQDIEVEEYSHRVEPVNIKKIGKEVDNIIAEYNYDSILDVYKKVKENLKQIKNTNVEEMHKISPLYHNPFNDRIHGMEVVLEQVDSTISDMKRRLNQPNLYKKIVDKNKLREDIEKNNNKIIQLKDYISTLKEVHGRIKDVFKRNTIVHPTSKGELKWQSFIKENTENNVKYNALDALKFIKKNSLKGNYFTELAQLLLNKHRDILEKVSLDFYNHPHKNKDDSFSAGTYGDINNVIYIFEAKSRPYANIEETVLHEIIHALTVRQLNQKEAKSYRNELERLLGDAKKHIKKNDIKISGAKSIDEVYGFKNIYEFTAEAFSSSEFQELLSKIPYESKSNKGGSIWTELTGIITRILHRGAKPTVPQTLISEIMRVTSLVMDVEVDNATKTNSISNLEN